MWSNNPQKTNGISFYRSFTLGIVNLDKDPYNTTQDELPTNLACFDLGINAKLDSNLH